MQLIEKFVEQRRAFEKAYEDGQWERLRPFFAEDVTYEVMNMPFHCVLKGVDTLIAGLKWSTDRFDQLGDREVGFDQKISEEGNNVLTHAGIRFSINGSPEIVMKIWEIATYRDGVIERLIDIYDPGDSERFCEWMSEWGEGLDPRYQ